MTIDDYDKSTFGGDLRCAAERDRTGLSHDLVWGPSATHTRTCNLRVAWEVDPGTGRVTGTIGRDTAPDELLPATGTTQTAAFVQDTSRRSALRLVPACASTTSASIPRPMRCSPGRPRSAPGPSWWSRPSSVPASI